MSQAFDHIVNSLGQISDVEMQSLLQLVAQQVRANNVNDIPHEPVSAFGWAKGRIKIADDFDAPLDDFKDYVE